MLRTFGLQREDERWRAQATRRLGAAGTLARLLGEGALETARDAQGGGRGAHGRRRQRRGERVEPEPALSFTRSADEQRRAERPLMARLAPSHRRRPAAAAAVAEAPAKPMAALTPKPTVAPAATSAGTRCDTCCDGSDEHHLSWRLSAAAELCSLRRAERLTAERHAEEKSELRPTRLQAAASV